MFVWLVVGYVLHLVANVDVGCFAVVSDVSGWSGSLI